MAKKKTTQKEKFFTFDKEVLKILKNFAQINQELYVNTDFVYSLSYDKSSFGLYSFKNKIDMDKPLLLYNASEFISLLSTFTNYQISQDENFIKIKNLDNGSVIKYTNIAEELSTIEENYNMSVKLLKEAGDPVAEFTFNVDLFYDVKKISSILKLSDILFTMSSDEVKIVVGNSNVYDDVEDIGIKNDNYEIILPDDVVSTYSEKEITKILDVESLKKMIPDDYDVKVYESFIVFNKKLDDAELTYVFSFYN